MHQLAAESPSWGARLGSSEPELRKAIAAERVLERDVAIKVMLPGIAHDPDQKVRFEREARAVARLTHPSVVTVFDLGYHTDGSPYIVMELLRGRDLQRVLRQGLALSLDQKVDVVLQVLDGLRHAHGAGIVHRDIKPANIFITEDGAAKIMDFGIARVASSSATGSGSLVGTASYMSPEQVRGERVDGRSDLFSVGTMLCEMLTGRRPFDGESAMVTFYRIAHEEPHSMGQVILEATRRVLDPDLVRRVLGDTSRALTLSNDPLLRSQNITLTPTDAFVLSRIDGTLSARDVVGLIPLAVEDAERSLFSLLCTGIVGYR